MDKHSAEVLCLQNHDATAKLIHIPIHCRITSQFIHHKFNVTWLAMEEDAVAFHYLFARLVFENH